MRSGSKGFVTAKPAHPQGQCCAISRDYAVPLLHQSAASLSGENSVFSNLQKLVQASEMQKFAPEAVPKADARYVA